ncbi:MAG: DUF2807 domain-containing protein [Bacteroidota bacterium]
MKNIITIMIVLIAVSVSAQVIGNKEVITKNYELGEIYKVDVQMYAKVIIDMEREAGITITGESNIIDLIRRKEKRGRLLLDQKKWIEPTQEIIIEIGAPGLREVEMGTHDRTIVKNITGNLFKVDAPIGEVILEGAVEELRIKSKMGIVDASKLITENADVRIKQDGKAIVNASLRVDCDLSEEATFRNVHPSAGESGCANQEGPVKIDTRYINLKIKNNSSRRNHFVVVGPKPDGRKFSYGFPMMPQQTKEERWTVGTKIYKENSIGIRTLLVTLTESDENEVVELFE